ncbi:MATH and LRR domain-containing protein PFE0570w-like isoform X2 [Penaeus japonicus]|uniref:MATH and LRR domain-containing protein PFE0570w-like isoform X2 n=1 Tax=Penaeus japonicus TaxID=27405 RepID=UPI001C717522|nr:MATH and LRR domain-containing protein PFE0570w-like isoform X2 [Penaeus japonicus]XP_042868057.1 MATH and LRR domain-containing protein PFE0570w-like isoform X2 [Penaeus japonicus]XP_042868062.1 MATH and LRR domain-containing protein PFE0570w-like isoform X2 [Penaeus japonicus]XP_042868072.1 MATH and LRR domain-containing protein PFE0570w-like isoform X2 [Penaeus japonicus]
MANSRRLLERRVRGTDEETVIFDKSTVKRYGDVWKFHPYPARNEEPNIQSWEMYSHKNTISDNSSWLRDSRFTPSECGSYRVASAIERETPETSYHNDLSRDRLPIQEQESVARNGIYSENEFVSNQNCAGTAEIHNTDTSFNDQRDLNINESQLNDNRDYSMNLGKDKQHGYNERHSRKGKRSVEHRKGNKSKLEKPNSESAFSNDSRICERTYKNGLLYWTDCRYAKMKLNKNCVNRVKGFSQFLNCNMSSILKDCWLKEIVPRKMGAKEHIHTENLLQTTADYRISNVQQTSNQEQQGENESDSRVDHTRSIEYSIMSQEHLQENQVNALSNQGTENESDTATRTDEYQCLNEQEVIDSNKRSHFLSSLGSVLASLKKITDNVNPKASHQKDDISSKLTPGNDSINPKITRSNVTSLEVTHSNETSAEVTHSNVTRLGVTHNNETSVEVTHSNETSAEVTHSNETSSEVTHSNETSSELTRMQGDTSLNMRHQNSIKLNQKFSDITQMTHEKADSSSNMTLLKADKMYPKATRQKASNVYVLKTSRPRHVGTPKSITAVPSNQLDPVPHIETSVLTTKHITDHNEVHSDRASTSNTSGTQEMSKTHQKESVNRVPQKLLKKQTLEKDKTTNEDSLNNNRKESMGSASNRDNENCMSSKEQSKQRNYNKDNEERSRCNKNKKVNVSVSEFNNSDTVKKNSGKDKKRGRENQEKTECYRGEITKKRSINEDNIEKDRSEDERIREIKNKNDKGDFKGKNNLEKSKNEQQKVCYPKELNITKEKFKGSEKISKGNETKERQCQEKSERTKKLDGKQDRSEPKKGSDTEKTCIRNKETNNSEVSKQTKETREKYCEKNSKNTVQKDRKEKEKRLVIGGIGKEKVSDTHTRKMLQPLDKETEMTILKTLLKHELRKEKRKGKITEEVIERRILENETQMNRTSSDSRIRVVKAKDHITPPKQKNKDKVCESEKSSDNINAREGIENKRKAESDDVHERHINKKSRTDIAVEPNEVTETNVADAPLNQSSNEKTRIDSDDSTKQNNELTTPNEDQSLHDEVVGIKQEHLDVDIKAEFEENSGLAYETNIKMESTEVCSESDYLKNLELESLLREWMQDWVIKKSLFDDFYDMLTSLKRPIWSSEDHTALYNIEVNMRLFFLSIFCNQTWNATDVCKSMQEFPKITDFFIYLNKCSV